MFMRTSNISSLDPLSPEPFVIVRCTEEIVVGEGMGWFDWSLFLKPIRRYFTVVTMYVQVNHKGAPSTDSVGVPSYINLQTIVDDTPVWYSGVSALYPQHLSVARLYNTTFLRIPATHILFSMASCSQITRQDLSMNGHPLILCSFSLSMLGTLSA